jgi:hypothetical protein
MALPMPITYAIDTALNRVTITYRGLITPEDNLATYLRYLRSSTKSVQISLI